MPHCILVGAGFGISEAVARQFGKEGYTIGLISRNEQSLRKLSSNLAALDINVHYRVADAGNQDSLISAIKELETEVAPCSCLIYNAAVLTPKNPLDLTLEDLRDEFRVNVEGALTAVKTVVPGMKKRKSGTIIFTGGGLALEPYPEWTSLALGKAALRSLAFSLHKELAPEGVLVSIIAVCGIVAPNTEFDPESIANEYWKLANASINVENREVIFQPSGTDPYYNDPNRVHRTTTLTPEHAKGAQ